MAQYHNRTKNFLWNRGFRPFVVWTLIGILGYAVYFIINIQISHSTSLLLKVVWILGTIYLFYRWCLYMNLNTDSEITWAHGFMGEREVRKKLLKELPDNWHVFYDLKPNWWRGNIDFVLVSSQGIFTLEVKTWSKLTQNIRKYWYMRKAWGQSHFEAMKLYTALSDLHPHWIQSVLVLANQPIFTHRKQGNVHVIGIDEISHYFNNETNEQNKNLSPELVQKIVTRLESISK